MGTAPAWGRLEMVNTQKGRAEGGGRNTLGKKRASPPPSGSANTGQDQREGKLLQMWCPSSRIIVSMANSPPGCPFLNLCWKTIFQKSIFFLVYQSWLRLASINAAWPAVCSPVHHGSLACVLQEKYPFGTLLQCVVFIAIR